jgi:hypothetical protein
MKSYTVDGNVVNFNEELSKMLKDDDDDDDDVDDTNKCRITNQPLTDKYVTLECNHKFNYDALYKEICKQKYVFKTYDDEHLKKNDKLLFLKSGKDYFIRCPYCRHIQFEVIPYYEGLGIEEKYGVNSVKKDNRQYYLHGQRFILGVECFHTEKGEKCCNAFSTTLKDTGLTYCNKHYLSALKKYRNEINAKLEAEKNAENEKKQIAKLNALEKMNAHKKALEELNTERAANGLALLKRLPPVKKSIDDKYVENDALTQPINESGCVAILKYGIRKGECCGVGKYEYCGKHLPKS